MIDFIVWIATQHTIAGIAMVCLVILATYELRKPTK